MNFYSSQRDEFSGPAHTENNRKTLSLKNGASVTH